MQIRLDFSGGASGRDAVQAHPQDARDNAGMPAQAPLLPDFHPAVSAWFERTFPGPTEAQARAWPAFHLGLI